jgi:hypothetical protein
MERGVEGDVLLAPATDLTGGLGRRVPGTARAERRETVENMGSIIRWSTHIRKIMRGLVPNPGITTRWNPRTGMHINLPIMGGSCHIQKLRRESCLIPRPESV